MTHVAATLAPERYDSLGALLADALVQFKTDTALIEANRQRETARYSYLQLQHQAWRVAARLQGCARVAILMSNQSKWLISATGLFFAGCTLVPLDYKLGPEEQRALLAHAKPDALIIEYPLWRRLTKDGPLALRCLVSEAPAGQELAGAERWESGAEPEAHGVSRQLPAQDRDAIAAIVYSSGTGGAPKGCMLSHGAYLSQLQGLLTQFPMARGDRYFSILPTNHAIDFMVGFLGPLCCGAAVVHQRTLRPEFLRATMQRYHVTHMSVVPLVLEAFERGIREQLDALPGWQAQLVDTAIAAGAGRWLRPIHQAFGGQLKLLVCGGAFVDPARVRFFHQLGFPLVIGYGLTEACTVVSVHSAHNLRADGVGRPCPGVELRIAEPDAHGVGEVQVAGPTLMSGYLDDPEQTAAAFTADGWLRSGDLGRLDASGALQLLGRRKNMIVTAGGKNIYPEDIEGSFDDLDCDELVIYAADYLWPASLAQGGDQLVAVVRGGDRASLLPALRARNRRLPDFKRVSATLAWPEPFPRTASMKVKRAALAEQIRASTPRDALRPLQLPGSP